ncbi:helix-turn-helix domain-containing protein [Clostridium neonatale]|uniref:Transposase Synechocystis PCC 6803 domain-containing protein n=1 Tax=Clostridium neonatale TaxID=137838 RepID=A0AAD2DD79_9CLOT|nr:helix-turn-helix domain-containing protein [Clostridium neonatale]CAI3193255.1 hypothetical protein CNEO2_110061 [Clostridium neonatale]CAI3197006.1 hypothetical protein CNEO2_150060 [Clostridium neonatale]CAI3214317.1 hypothetical protein CNEO2_60070 [Clostridium neonatale]CAI3217973.1 hypothetical protein CNEO2_100062 [Clostridium neonatale]CAI3239646.1 hypothetical protein CNEO2_20056 [Clostridium neonatale]
MITQQQSEMIDYIIAGNNKTETAKLLGVSRNTVYDWLKIKEVQEEKKKRIEEIKADTRTSLTPKVKNVFDEIYKLAINCKDNRVKFQACKYICDQVIGAPSIDKSVQEDEKKEITVTLFDDDPSIDDMLAKIEEKEININE